MPAGTRLTRRARDPRRAAGALAARVFGTVARLRGDRALHPHGVVFGATFTPVPVAETRASSLFAGADARAALIRFSRGGGLPEAFPDVRGCAIRVVDAYGNGEHQDFLLASSLAAPLGRHLLVPGWDFGQAFYSSLLTYRIGSHRLVFGAALEQPVGASLDEVERTLQQGDRRLRLLAAGPLGGWRDIAHVDIEARAPQAQDLRFNPWTMGGGIMPLGPLNGLRDPAYRASQAASR
jgi:hypothetical protein